MWSFSLACVHYTTFCGQCQPFLSEFSAIIVVESGGKQFDLDRCGRQMPPSCSHYSKLPAECQPFFVDYSEQDPESRPLPYQPFSASF